MQVVSERPKGRFWMVLGGIGVMVIIMVFALLLGFLGLVSDWLKSVHGE